MKEEKSDYFLKIKEIETGFIRSKKRTLTEQEFKVFEQMIGLNQNGYVLLEIYMA
jgi:hypothetical protein